MAVCWSLLHKSSLTVFVDLLLFANEPAHPQRVAVVKNEALIVRILRAVILQDMRTLLVLPQLEKILGQQQNRLYFWLSVLNPHLVLLLIIGVAVDEALGEEALIDVGLRGHSQQQLSNPR